MKSVDVDVEKLLAGMVAAVTEGIKVSDNKEVTVDDIINILKAGLNGAGIGDIVVIDFQSVTAVKSPETATK